VTDGIASPSAARRCCSRASLEAGSATRYLFRILVGEREGLFLTVFVNLLSLISFVGDSDGRLRTGHSIIGNGQPSGTPMIATTSRKRLLDSVLERYGADLGVVSAPARADGRKGRARVSWRRDGR
jgi:hypothetical protein